MTPDAFVAKGKGATLKERSALQEHIVDLGRLLAEPRPAQADPRCLCRCFEISTTKVAGGDGFVLPGQSTTHVRGAGCR